MRGSRVDGLQTRPPDPSLERAHVACAEQRRLVLYLYVRAQRREAQRRGAQRSTDMRPATRVLRRHRIPMRLKDLLTFMSGAHYELRSFATDDERNNVSAYGVFLATHTGEGGPCPPTGKSMKADYVYVMEFDGEKIRHMTKIWNAGWTLKELGWV